MLTTCIPFFLLLSAQLSSALVQQIDVPVFLASHKVSHGIYKYQEKYQEKVVPFHSIDSITKSLLDNCNSNAYLFINQPGIRKSDFVEYKKELLNLQRYLTASSTAIKFEQVDILPVFFFDALIDHVQESCNIEEVIEIDGNNTDSFQPYVDINKRVIRIDFPRLPQDSSARSMALSDYDKNLRTILAQIPSPEFTFVYTSLRPDMESKDEDTHYQVFPEIFSDPSRKEEIEKNNHLLDSPRTFIDYRPKFRPINSKYLSLLDEKFIADNFELIKLIITVLIGYFAVYLISPRKSPKALIKNITPNHDNLKCEESSLMGGTEKHLNADNHQTSDH